MKILALDPATSCGYFHSDGIGGTWDLSVKRDESSGMRLIRLRGKLNEIRETLGVDLVVFESARNAKFAGTVRVLGEILGLVSVWCADNAIEHRGYSPMEIKKFATGKGNASKEQMVDAYERIVKRPVEDSENDMVDAWWLLQLAKKEYA